MRRLHRFWCRINEGRSNVVVVAPDVVVTCYDCCGRWTLLLWLLLLGVEIFRAVPIVEGGQETAAILDTGDAPELTLGADTGASNG
jgi:hypothetical protein